MQDRKFGVRPERMDLLDRKTGRVGSTISRRPEPENTAVRCEERRNCAPQVAIGPDGPNGHPTGGSAKVLPRGRLLDPPIEDVGVRERKETRRLSQEGRLSGSGLDHQKLEDRLRDLERDGRRTTARTQVNQEAIRLEEAWVLRGEHGFNKQAVNRGVSGRLKLHRSQIDRLVPFG